MADEIVTKEDMLRTYTNDDLEVLEGNMASGAVPRYRLSQSQKADGSWTEEGSGYAVGSKGTSVLSDGESVSVPGATSGTTQPQQPQQAQREPTAADIFAMVDKQSGNAITKELYQGSPHENAAKAWTTEKTDLFKKIFPGYTIDQLHNMPKDMQKHWQQIEPKAIAHLYQVEQDKQKSAGDARTKALHQLEAYLHIYDREQKQKHEAKVEAAAARKEEAASKTDYQSAHETLREELKREPTASEIRKRIQTDKIAVSGAQAKNKQDIAASGLSPEALQIEGIKFATTGKMPAMGMGAPAVRMKIMTAAADYMKEQGIDPKSVPAMQAEFAATAKAFSAIKTPLANFKAFEGALIKNSDYALTLSKENYRTQLPSVNTVLNAIKTGTGDPKIVKFSAAIYAAALEYEKIRTAGTNITSAELSVGAQKKAEEIMNKAQTHAQLEGVIEALKVDSHNVVSSREEQIKSLGGEMRKLEGTFGKSNEGANVVETRKTKDGRILEKLSDGTVRERPKQ